MHRSEQSFAARCTPPARTPAVSIILYVHLIRPYVPNVADCRIACMSRFRLVCGPIICPDVYAVDRSIAYRVLLVLASKIAHQKGPIQSRKRNSHATPLPWRPGFSPKPPEGHRGPPTDCSPPHLALYHLSWMDPMTSLSSITVNNLVVVLLGPNDSTVPA